MEGVSLGVILSPPFPGIKDRFKCQVSEVLYNYCLVFLPLLVLVHIQDTKPWLSVVDAAARLPWGLKDFISLSSTFRTKAVCAPSISVIFLRVGEYLKLSLLSIISWQ